MEEKIEDAKSLNDECLCLYSGKSEISLASIAPYLFTFNKDNEFEHWFFDKGWGDSWGVLVYSRENMKTLHKHFRKFLMVKTETGESLFFRFYDPRVLRLFLPTCDHQQLKEFFGPVDYFICEDEDPANALIFSFREEQLVTSKLTKEQVMIFEPVVKIKPGFSFF